MKKILNIGCGQETYGTHFIDLYPSRKEVIKCDVEKDELPFPPNFFDEVYFRGLYEHLKNPGIFLKKIFNIIKPGGKVVIITDNASRFHILSKKFMRTSGSVLSDYWFIHSFV